MKGYVVCVWEKIDNEEKLKEYALKAKIAADKYSAQTANMPESLITGLKKMSRENLSNLTPHWLNVFLNYSHPPVLKRVEALKEYIK